MFIFRTTIKHIKTFFKTDLKSKQFKKNVCQQKNTTWGKSIGNVLINV